jgi:hypothetical protein
MASGPFLAARRRNLGMGGNRWFVLACALIVGCASPKPSAAPVAAPTPPAVAAKIQVAATVVLLEPYLEPATPAQMVLPPPSLVGRIQMSPPPNEPLVPSAPPATETRPIPNPPPSTPPASKRPSKPSPGVVGAMVQLLQDERSRSADLARRQLSLASARVAQTAAEAKKTGDLVRAGALAQFKLTQADAAARDAVAEQAEAQRTLDDAQQRVTEARKDVESVLNAVSELPFSLAQFATPPVAFRPVPFTYRLTVLGATPLAAIQVEGGTLGRVLERGKGEAGAWIVRCQDPSKLRVIVGETETQTIVRSLPRTDPARPRA